MVTATDPQTRLQSAELLRVVLGKMGAHADGYEPISYALWYEYCRGALPKLREDIDALIVGSGDRLTTDQTRALSEKHIRDRPAAAFATARVGLLAVLNQMESTLGDAAASSTAYDSTLQTFEGSLQKGVLEGVHEQLASVVAHTSEIRGSIGSLSEELISNKAQVGRLTEELNRLREDVLTDPLTALMNRRGFDAAILSSKQIADASRDTFSLVMIDIDHFKRVNDTHGHLVGDRVIQQVAAAMKSCVRGGDTAARYGGEEFALLLPSTAARGAQTVAEYIRHALQRTPIGTLTKGTLVDSVTVSAGIAVFKPGESVEECIRRADRALYAAKHGGRNRVVVATD